MYEIKEGQRVPFMPDWFKPPPESTDIDGKGTNPKPPRPHPPGPAPIESRFTSEQIKDGEKYIIQFTNGSEKGKRSLEKGDKIELVIGYDDGRVDSGSFTYRQIFNPSDLNFDEIIWKKLIKPTNCEIVLSENVIIITPVDLNERWDLELTGFDSNRILKIDVNPEVYHPESEVSNA